MVDHVGLDNKHLLQGRVALVLGGTTGIGLATAKAFAAAGAAVVVAARNEERGRLVQQELQGVGANLVFRQCDVTDPASVAALVSFVVGRFGHLSCAVNSAAFDSNPAATHDVQPEDAAGIISTDVLGVFNGMKYEIEAMLQRGEGTIVNVSSINGLSGVPTAAVYSAAKHAVVGLTRSAAKEYIARGIRINAVCPGATDTPRRERRIARMTQEQQQQHHEAMANAIPIGRLARAEEIANAVLWLSSPASSYVVGHSLVVDGGMLA
jgi:NAD(P)-dependent dehydrogenase (short-subunit alcohol dehydrogenase family)